MKIRNGKWIFLRWLAYILIPVLCLMGIINFNVIKEVSVNNTEVYEADNFYESDLFSEQAISKLIQILYNVHVVNSETYEEYDIVEVNGTQYSLINPYYSRHDDFDFFYINHEYKVIYKNRSNIDLEKYNYGDVDGKYYYKSVGGVEESTIGENLAFYDVDTEYVDIYFSMDEVNYTSSYYWQNIWYDIVVNTFEYAAVNIILIGLLLFVLVILMFIGVGKKRKTHEININIIDEIPFEIIVFVGVVPLFIGFSSFNGNIIFQLIDLGLLYLIWLNILITFIKRIKGKIFLVNTLIYRIYHSSFNFLKVLAENLKIAIMIVLLALINLIIIAGELNFFLVLIYIFIWFFVIKFIYNRYKVLKKLKNLINDIYLNNDYEIDRDLYSKEYYEVAEKLDKISDGFNEALESKLVSERMKSELITNVSHDIKTPLTSIINYVDLLKKENIKDKKVIEYINILSNKADRLRKLTEDLVELSKASSGNLKITFSNINIDELIKQLNAEYSDKFDDSKLDISYNSVTKAFIKADSKYIYRVFDNIYSNVVKYSMKNTRVYVEVLEENNNIIVEIKNISKEKLNISKEELVQRFVRGDSSRTEQGSGLGLSIVENLVNLQDGDFDIIIDGDLFKVILIFRKGEDEL